jgi:cell division protein FtsI/penicillin-binding protein 2
VASPGSAIKPFVLLRLLESGLLRPEETFSCRRNLQIGGRRMDCTHPAELTHFDAAQALAFSCNSYFATAAARLRPEELEKLYLELGFTHPTGKLPDEAEGRVLRARDRGEMQLQALGSADVWVTPIELAVAYLRLARAAAGSPSAAQKTVLAGLRGAVDYGIASEASVDGMAVSGKTGTAADASGQPTHAWFAGFAPSKHPEIVVLVFVESGSGRASAAPVAQRILRAWKAGAR